VELQHQDKVLQVVLLMETLALFIRAQAVAVLVLLALLITQQHLPVQVVLEQQLILRGV
jgi:hypothetical protein